MPAAATERLYQKFTNGTLVRCPGSDHAPPKFSGDSLPLVAAFFNEVLQAPPLPPPPPLSRQSSASSPKSPKRSLNIAGASHYVKGKNGGLVREAASLDSAEVALLPTLQPVRVVEHRALPTRPDGRPGVERCRIVEPVRGWVSRRCLKSVADLTSEEPSVVVSGGPGPPAL